MSSGFDSSESYVSKARNYIKYVIFEEWLGLNYTELFQISFDSGNIVFSRDHKKLIISDSWFLHFYKEISDKSSLPIFPIRSLKIDGFSIFKELNFEYVPILYGEDKLVLEENFVHLGIDIFGSSFFMLTRYEELVKSDRDDHERFPAKASIAYHAGFLEKPIVDQYVEILWRSVHYLWPDLERKKHQFKQYVSCDVDFVWDSRLMFPRVIKTLAGDVIRRKSIKSFFRTLKNFVFKINPYDNFKFQMDVCEEAEAHLAFYFISRKSKEFIDGDYDIDDPYTKSLLKEIHERGHEIGLHPSYLTFQDLEKTKSELSLFKQVLSNIGLDIEIRGGRQHYLRWSNPETARNWNSLGVRYDSTLGYADHVGFRCGTCREYPFYDVLKSERLDLIIRPLVAMEVSVLSDQYMGYDCDSARNKLLELKRTCQQYNGNFVFLWHNNYFDEKEYFSVFKDVIDGE